MPSTIDGVRFSSSGNDRVPAGDPNRLSGSHSVSSFGVTEALSWTLRRCGGDLRLADLKFEHMRFPTWEDWHEIAEQVGTIDGNIVRLKAIVANDGPDEKATTVKFRDTYKGDKWNGSRPDGLLGEPTLLFGPQTRDEVRQWTAGLAYEGRWKGVGELSVGLQKTSYRKRLLEPGEMPVTTTDSPLLFNATTAIYVTDAVALYGSFTQGLEESPVAPGVAVNRDEAPPALRTRQFDAGVRWSATPSIRLVAGVFEVTKPFFSLDSARVFQQLGTVRHRGAEFSLSGQIAPGLTAVLGTALIDARLSGDAVDKGLVGKKPLASFGRLSTAVFDYRPPFAKALSVDLIVESTSDRIASTDGKLVIPARAIASIGGRYRFHIGKAPTTLRAQVANIGNKFGWANGQSGIYLYNFPRRFTLTLTSDIG